MQIPAPVLKHLLNEALKELEKHVPPSFPAPIVNVVEGILQDVIDDDAVVGTLASVINTYLAQAFPVQTPPSQ